VREYKWVGREEGERHANPGKLCGQLGLSINWEDIRGMKQGDWCMFQSNQVEGMML
jgi:hypothetical protein